MAKKANGHTNGHSQPGHNSGWRARVYNVIEHDPEIDRFPTRTSRAEAEKLVQRALYLARCRLEYPASTVHNMFNGKTRRPQHATFAKIAGAMGYQYDLVRQGDAPDYTTEILKARAEFKQYKKSLAKKRAAQADDRHR